MFRFTAVHSILKSGVRRHATRAASSSLRQFSTAAQTSSSGGQELERISGHLPHLDVVRYQHKNRVWSLNHVQFYSEALAIGLLENGLQAGDRVLSWLPDHFSEQMVLQFACSKAGLILYSLDPTAPADTNAAKESLKAALSMTQANVLVSPENHDDINFLSLCKSVIPETQTFDFSEGMPFVSPRFPHLRLPIQTGFDQNDEGGHGFLLLRHMIVPSGNLDALAGTESNLTDSPLAGQFMMGDDGVPTGLKPTLTNSQVISNSEWPTYCKILKKEFHDVEGIGVNF